MLRTGDIKCPTCGGDILNGHTIDIEETTSGVVVMKHGSCEHCGNNYDWDEVFSYEGYTTPKKVTLKVITLDELRKMQNGA